MAPIVAASAATAPPGFGAITASVSSGIGDAGTFDAYTYASVDWGDGNGPIQVPVASLGSLSHDYGTGGEFDATVSVQDDDLTQGSASVHPSVAQPPTTTTTTTTTVSQPTTTTVSVTTTTVAPPTTTTVSGATTTTTTLPCTLSQLPDDSFAGLDCALGAVRTTVAAQPQPACTCKRCSLDEPVDRILGLVAEAQGATAKKCKRKLEKARQVAKAFERKARSLGNRGCLAPVDRLTALEAELTELVRRLRAVAGGASCGAQ